MELGPCTWMPTIQVSPSRTSMLRGSIIGDASTVKARLQEFLDTTQVDEIIIHTMAYDHEARKRSYEIVADVRKAIAMLDRHVTVISASKPPAGHARHKPVPGEAEADYRCLAFEVRGISEFSGGGIGTGEEEVLFIGWDSFAELIRPGDEAEVAARIASWRA